MDHEKLEYYIADRNGTAIVSFIGSLTNASASALTPCLAQFEATDTGKYRLVIINFRDCEIEEEAFQIVERIQMAVRKKEATLKLCGFRPEFKQRLMTSGLIRPHEIFNNIKDALSDFLQK